MMVTDIELSRSPSLTSLSPTGSFHTKKKENLLTFTLALRSLFRGQEHHVDGWFECYFKANDSVLLLMYRITAMSLLLLSSIYMLVKYFTEIGFYRALAMASVSSSFILLFVATGTKSFKRYTAFIRITKANTDLFWNLLIVCHLYYLLTFCWVASSITVMGIGRTVDYFGIFSLLILFGDLILSKRHMIFMVDFPFVIIFSNIPILCRQAIIGKMPGWEDMLFLELAMIFTFFIAYIIAQLKS